MHFFDAAWVLLSQGVPRFVPLKVNLEFPHTNRMQGAVQVLARARDNVGIEEFT